MYSRLVLASTALVVMGAYAHASDVTQQGSSWTGFYLGVGGGGAANFSGTDGAGYSVIDLDGTETNDALSGFVDDGFDAGADFFDGTTQFGSFTADCDGAAEVGCEGDVRTAASIGDGERFIPVALFDEITEILNGGDGGNPYDGENHTGLPSAYGTAEVGLDWQLGSSLVLGLNGGFNFGQAEIQNGSAGGIDSDYEVDDVDAEGNADYVTELSTTLQIGNSWTVGSRAGYLLNDSNLLFIAGGYVSAKAKLSASYSSTSNAEVDEGAEDFDMDSEFYVSSSSEEWLHGYYIGAGMESLITENISFKMEYRFSDLGSLSTQTDYSTEIAVGDSEPKATGFAGAGVSAESQPLIHAVRATVAWRF
jgi:outer membrane immunogenic protein